MYKIYGTYKGKRELIDEADDLNSALYLKGEYQLAYGSEWTITIKKKGDR